MLRERLRCELPALCSKGLVCIGVSNITKPVVWLVKERYYDMQLTFAVYTPEALNSLRFEIGSRNML